MTGWAGVTPTIHQYISRGQIFYEVMKA